MPESVDRGAYSNGYVLNGVPRNYGRAAIDAFYDDSAAMVASQATQMRGCMYKAGSTYYVLSAETFTGNIADYDAL